ncbi:ATP-binding protein [Streptacidiphilus monticola]
MQGPRGFFFEATEAADAESLRRIGALIGEYAGSPFPVRPADWHEVLDALLALGEQGPATVVIDEFPYLAKANPSLPSVIQAAFGPRREERLRSQTRLLLCGSAMSFMGGLLSGTAPLRGRAGLEMVVQTLDYRLAADFWGITDPHLAVLLYSVVGGTPAYRDGAAGGRAPESIADFDAWVVDNVLDRFSPLFREARYLLAEEPDIRDKALYHSVLAAVAEGNNTRGGIAGYLERKATDISHHLSVLEDTGLLVRAVDAFRPGRSVPDQRAAGRLPPRGDAPGVEPTGAAGAGGAGLGEQLSPLRRERGGSALRADRPRLGLGLRCAGPVRASGRRCRPRRRQRPGAQNLARGRHRRHRT